MMLRPTWTLSLMTVLTATALVACGDDKGTSDDATAGQTDPSGATDNATSSTGSSDDTGSATDAETGTGGTDTPTTTMTTMTGDTAADGETCTVNGDCASLACLKYRDLEDGECVAAPAGGSTRVVGTLVDFASGMPIASTELRVIGALSALTDPGGASPVVMATSDASGQVDATSAMPLKEGIGIVGIVTGGDYYTTATGLAAPTAGKYGPMSSNRDIWAVPSAKLTEWSGYLMTDVDVAPSLPLGDMGGVVGFVREGQGAGKAGAKVVPVKGTTGAFIRYLAEDGMSFTSDMTSSNGIFIIVGPGLAEQFTVEGGTSVGTAGSSAGAVFVMILTEP